ncbi:MAG: hypothetical protein ACXVB4_06900 [Pseudobdellovibrionaceae bacterium]
MMGKTLFLILVGVSFFFFQNCQKTKFTAVGPDSSFNVDSTSSTIPNTPSSTSGSDIIIKLEPALAIRGMGCIQCHGNVDSNILTDFGFKGDGKGNDYYFNQNLGQKWWSSGGIYGDHGNNFNTMVFSADKSVFVPKAALPSYVASATNLTTLASYIQSQLSKAADSVTRNTQVLEKTSVYIGAPTEADLTSIFSLSAGDRFKYVKDNSNASELAGLQDRSTFFENNSVLACEGDLLLRGPLLLQNLQINSRTGCRIHVLGSVFIYGPITFVNSDNNRNIQIMSTKSINMGLGLVKSGNTFCEPNSRWATNSTDPSYANPSSLLTRYTDIWTVPSQFVRQSTDPDAFGKSVIAEAQLIEATTGTLYDASCRPEGRNVSFDRIVLNAPAIHSRYQGDVSGTLIAEYSLMSLGAFKFKFDPVFIQVPLFPKVNRKLYLDVVD